jgi:hypothetical protein
MSRTMRDVESVEIRLYVGTGLKARGEKHGRFHLLENRYVTVPLSSPHAIATDPSKPMEPVVDSKLLMHTVG